MTQAVQFSPESAAIYQHLRAEVNAVHTSSLDAKHIEDEITRVIALLATGNEVDYLMRHRLWVPDADGAKILAYSVLVAGPTGAPDAAVMWHPLDCGTPYVFTIDLNYQR